MDIGATERDAAGNDPSLVRGRGAAKSVEGNLEAALPESTKSPVDTVARPERNEANERTLVAGKDRVEQVGLGDAHGPDPTPAPSSGTATGHGAQNEKPGVAWDRCALHMRRRRGATDRCPEARHIGRWPFGTKLAELGPKLAELGAISAKLAGVDPQLVDAGRMLAESGPILVHSGARWSNLMSLADPGWSVWADAAANLGTLGPSSAELGRFRPHVNRIRQRIRQMLGHVERSCPSWAKSGLRAEKLRRRCSGRPAGQPRATFLGGGPGGRPRVLRARGWGSALRPDGPPGGGRSASAAGPPRPRR